MATLNFYIGGCKLIKGLVRTTLSFNKMLVYIIELGYNEYIKKFDKYYEEQNKRLEREDNAYE